jgi:hypothetical protein
VRKCPPRPRPRQSEFKRNSTEPESCAGPDKTAKSIARLNGTMAQSVAQCSTSAHQRFGEARTGATGSKDAANHTETRPPAGVAVAPASSRRLHAPTGAEAGASRTGKRLQVNECTSCSGTSSSSATAPEPRARGRCVAGGARASPADTDKQRGGTEMAAATAAGLSPPRPTVTQQLRGCFKRSIGRDRSPETSSRGSHQKAQDTLSLELGGATEADPAESKRRT